MSRLTFSSWTFAWLTGAYVIGAYVCEKLNKMHDADRLMELAVMSLLAAILLRIKP